MVVAYHYVDVEGREQKQGFSVLVVVPLLRNLRFEGTLVLRFR
jgi:hypothetical protein